MSSPSRSGAFKLKDLFGETAFGLEEIVALARSRPSDGEARIERVFDWQIQRQGAVLAVGIPIWAASLAALVSPFFQAKKHLGGWEVVLIAVALAVSGGVAGVAIRLRGHALQRRYVHAITFYGLWRQTL